MASIEEKGDEEYVCTLSSKDLEKAKKELNEEPDQRISQIRTFRNWVLSQPQLSAKTDTQNMLRILRGSKWSQLKAREMLEGLMGLVTRYPDWFRDVDTAEEDIQYLASLGHILPLGKDPQGRHVIFFVGDAIDPDDKRATVAATMRLMVAAQMMVAFDETVQVNGLIMIQDMTGTTMKHMSRMKTSDWKKIKDCWSGNMPGRMKGFHYYNPGPLFESMMQIVRPFMRKKYLDRMRTHNTMESLYKEFSMEIFPREYLPDDYKGPCAGTKKEINDRFISSLNNPKFRSMVKEMSSSKYWFDETKKVQAAEPAASFRKLNVD